MVCPVVQGWTTMMVMMVFTQIWIVIHVKWVHSRVRDLRCIQNLCTTQQLTGKRSFRRLLHARERDRKTGFHPSPYVFWQSPNDLGIIPKQLWESFNGLVCFSLWTLSNSGIHSRDGTWEKFTEHDSQREWNSRFHGFKCLVGWAYSMQNYFTSVNIQWICDSKEYKRCVSLGNHLKLAQRKLTVVVMVWISICSFSFI